MEAVFATKKSVGVSKWSQKAQHLKGTDRESASVRDKKRTLVCLTLVNQIFTTFK